MSSCADTLIIILIIILIINFLKTYEIPTIQQKNETEAFTDEWGYDYKSLKKDWKPKKTSELKTLCSTSKGGKCVTY